MTVNIEFYRNTTPKRVLQESIYGGKPKVAYQDQDVIYIRKIQPGEFSNQVDRPATEDDKLEHALQWGQFQRGEEQIVDGTPVEKLIPLYAAGPKIVSGLKSMGVHTLEQLAGLSAHAVTAIGGGMGGQHWVNDAKRLLAQGNKAISESRYERDIKRLEARIEALEARLQRTKPSL